MEKIETSRIDAVIESLFSDAATKKAMSETSKLVRAFNLALQKLADKNPSLKTLIGATQIVDCKNKILMVETDHSGRIQLLQMQQNQIKKMINAELKCDFVNSILFRLKGQNYEIKVAAPVKKEEPSKEDAISEAEIDKKFEALKEKFRKNQ